MILRGRVWTHEMFLLLVVYFPCVCVFILFDSAVLHMVVCFMGLILNTEEICCTLTFITGLFMMVKIGGKNLSNGNG